MTHLTEVIQLEDILFQLDNFPCTPPSLTLSLLLLLFVQNLEMQIPRDNIISCNNASNFPTVEASVRSERKMNKV